MVRSGSVSRGVDPLQSHVLPAARRSRAGAGFLEVFRPFDDIVQASPVLRWSVHLHRGSALRLSQPLSGFLARLDFAALFHAAAIRGVHPTEP